MIDTIYIYLTNDLGFTEGTADAIVGGIIASILIVVILSLFKSARRFCFSIFKISIRFFWEKIKPCNWCKNKTCGNAKKSTNKTSSESLGFNKLNDLFIHEGISFYRGKTNRPICPECYNKNKLVYLTQVQTKISREEVCDINNIESKYFQLMKSLRLLDDKVLALTCSECDYEFELKPFDSLESVIEKASKL